MRGWVWMGIEGVERVGHTRASAVSYLYGAGSLGYAYRMVNVITRRLWSRNRDTKLRSPTATVCKRGGSGVWSLLADNMRHVSSRS